MENGLCGGYANNDNNVRATNSMPKTTKPFVKMSIYTKAIAISPDDLVYIKSIKSKKSAAGKLSEIIALYKKSNLSKH